MVSCTGTCAGLIGRGVAADLGQESSDVGDAVQQTGDRPSDVERRDSEYDYSAGLLKRLENNVEKRRFCRHNYVYNPVSGRCQASLLVRIHNVVVVYFPPYCHLSACLSIFVPVYLHNSGSL